jgi:hypothetical protein
LIKNNKIDLDNNKNIDKIEKYFINIDNVKGIQIEELNAIYEEHLIYTKKKINCDMNDKDNYVNISDYYPIEHDEIVDAVCNYKYENNEKINKIIAFVDCGGILKNID